MSEAPWDPGLQNERTGLAWQRSGLAGLACNLAVARLLVEVSLLLALLTGLVALLATAGLAGIAVRRFRDQSHALHEHRPIGDGLAPVLISVLVVLTALAAVVFVITA